MPLAREHVAEVGVAHRVVGLQGDGAAEAGRGLAEPAALAAGAAEVGVVGADGRVQRDGCGDAGDGHVILAPLVGDDAEQVQAVGMGRVGGEQVLVEALGLVEVAAAVEGDGGRQGFGRWVGQQCCSCQRCGAETERVTILSQPLQERSGRSTHSLPDQVLKRQDRC